MVKRGQGDKGKSRGVRRVQVGFNYVRWGQFWSREMKGDQVRLSGIKSSQVGPGEIR